MIISPFIATRVQKVANKLGLEIWSIFRNYSAKDIEIMDFAQPYTVTDRTDMKSLIDAVKYITTNKVPGVFVECGVLRGGAVIAMIKTLQQLNFSDREIYLFDTFGDMMIPTEHDVSASGVSAFDDYSTSGYDIARDTNPTDYPSLQNVKKNVNKTGYDKSKLKFIVGDVMETIQNNIPDKIALLRLDTDFYDSTKCELEYLFPKLSEGGILIIDDYGRWRGSRKATDEYIKNNNIKIFLNQIYPSGSVIGIKQKMTFK